MTCQIIVGGVDVRFIPTGLADTTFQVVGDNGFGNTAVKGKSTNMGAYPVLKTLTGRGFSIGIAAGTKHGYKDLGLVDCTGRSVNYINSLTGIVNEQLFPCPVFMTHDNIETGCPVTVTVAEPAVLVAIRVLLFVLLPEQIESDLLAGLQFFMDFVKVRDKSWLYNTWCR
jgi:hypothetical protein